MSEDIGVYIPTLGRCTLLQQLTLRELTSKSSYRPTLVCGPGEVPEHSKYYDGPIIEGPEGPIGRVSQFIFQESSERVVVIADDDLRFDKRVDPGNDTQLEVAQELDGMFESILRAVEVGYQHGGVGPRQGNTFIHTKALRTHLVGPTLIKSCFRAFNLTWFVRDTAIEEGARWDFLPIMEDFAFTLYMLVRGYPNAIINDYVWDHKGSNRVGGCSTYRTWEYQKRNAIKLKNRHPGFIALTRKKSKSRWEGLEDRWDVKIYWDKLINKYIPVDRRLYDIKT